MEIESSSPHSNSPPPVSVLSQILSQINPSHGIPVYVWKSVLILTSTSRFSKSALSLRFPIKTPLSAVHVTCPALPPPVDLQPATQQPVQALPTVRYRVFIDLLYQLVQLCYQHIRPPYHVIVKVTADVISHYLQITNARLSDQIQSF